MKVLRTLGQDSASDSAWRERLLDKTVTIERLLADQKRANWRAFNRKQNRERERASAKQKFQSSDWSLGNVLSWIAFRDQALICRFDGLWSSSGRYVRSLNRLRLYGFYRYRSFEERPMLVDTPAQVVLSALQDGDLTAIRDGQEIVRLFWFGRDVRDLTDDLHFQRDQALKCWPPEGDQAAVNSAETQKAHPTEPGSPQRSLEQPLVTTRSGPKGGEQRIAERDEAAASSAAATPATAIETATASVEKLAEWIFAKRTQLSQSEKLYEAAHQDKEIGAFRKVDFLAAYQRVYITEPHRPPASGWPLQPTYAKRAEGESLQNNSQKSF